MARYEIDLPEEISSCDECPCGDNAGGNMYRDYLFCQAADKVVPTRFEAGAHSPYQYFHHDMPNWCPMQLMT